MTNIKLAKTAPMIHINSETKLAYYHVDAFADRPFAGNQAAVIPLAEWLDDTLLQAIAAENNFSETAFFIPDDQNKTEQQGSDYQLRWFTPTQEIDLCGHATLASGHVILNAHPEIDAVRFRTRRAGILEVYRDQGLYALRLPAYMPTAKPLDAMCEKLGGTAVETHFHAANYALFIFADPEEIIALRPDMPGLAGFGDTLFIASARIPKDRAARWQNADIISRVFVPGAGIDEDSVTGAAHAVLTPFWSERMGVSSFLAYQASPRGGYVHCRYAEGKAVLGGQCVTIVEGRFRYRD